MNGAQIEKAYKNGNPDHFKVAADYITKYCDNDVLATEAVFNARKADFIAREILNEQNKSVISAVTAEDMATGAELVKGKYVLLGFLMGVALVTATGMIVNEFKKKGE